jgi:hypothetical protein
MRIRLVVLFAVFAAAASAQRAAVVPAESIYLPGIADSNSPIHWAGGVRYIYNSDGLPLRAEGDDLRSMRRVRAAHLLNSDLRGWWIEATHRDEDGTLFAWYHHETFGACPTDGDHWMAVPVIGAAVSKDNGRTFQDLGYVLTDGNPAKCDAKNGYFAGGHGDFSVILDRRGEYFYFFFSAYGGEAGEQGVAIARMRYADRYAPSGNVWKYREGAWRSTGVGGKVTPIIPVRTPWESEFADAFWGPSVHYNRELGEYVMLLNRACCEPGWPPEGIYISYLRHLDRPAAWSEPEQIMAGGGWYPMAVGLESGDTDKTAGARARLFLGSDSHWEIVFQKHARGVSSISVPSSVWDVETRRRRHSPFK